MPDQDLSSMRNEYEKFSLDEKQLSENPVDLFQEWFQAAVAGCKEPNAMTLSTVSAEFRPSSRIVLLKDFDENGFVFFTNYNSKKGKEMASNPAAALNFFWPELERQVRIEGMVSKVSEAESQEYFKTRPRLSQAGAIASEQSSEISDRRAMESEMNRLMSLPEDQDLQKPEHWGGYLLKPDFIEFWQGRPGRLHDRICYERKSEEWRRFRLAP